MPELPEVETNRRILKTRILHQTIDHVVVYYRNIVSGDLSFEAKLKDQTVVDIQRRAKYLIFILNDYALISHLRMEGKYMINEPRDQSHTHVEFYFKNGDVLGYHDTRKFGRFELILKDEVDRYFEVKKLASDPKDLNFADFYERIHNRSITIKELLLDQKVIGGIGNIYANEILFRAKIHPAKPGNLLKKDEIQTILEMSKAVISEAVHYGGTTIQSFETLGHKGSFQDHLQVHGKKGDPCPNCQTAIKKVMLKGRGTYYCPNCQRSYIIAMTGGISSGKSTVSHYLKKKGFSVFDSDKAVYELYQDRALRIKIAERFQTIKDHDLDKEALKQRIFNDAQQRKALEDILHPLVFDKIQAFIDKEPFYIVFLDIPLLFESKYEGYDQSLLIDISFENQLNRLMKRDQISVDEAIKRIKIQMPLSKKRKRADHIIVNNQDYKALYAAVDNFLKQF